MNISEYLVAADSISIISGEGEVGTVEKYMGKRSVRAVKARLTRERCHGDRWAHVEIDGVRLEV